MIPISDGHFVEHGREFHLYFRVAGERDVRAYKVIAWVRGITRDGEVLRKHGRLEAAWKDVCKATQAQTPLAQAPTLPSLARWIAEQLVYAHVAPRNKDGSAPYSVSVEVHYETDVVRVYNP